MSVNTDANELKPPDDEFLLWVIEDTAIGSELGVTEAGPPHHHIGPAHEMTLAELQQRIADTRDRWQRVQ